MNKIFAKFQICLLLLTMLSIPAYSQEYSDEVLTEKISQIGFKKLFSTTPEEEVIKFFDKNIKYANKHNMKKLQSLYDTHYLTSDGFDKDIYFKMIEKTWQTYPSVQYSTKIKDLDINENYATVHVIEKATGTAKSTDKNLKSEGEINSVSYTIYYLQKFGKTWKITSSNIIQETTSLCYGDAKNLDIELNAPNQVNAGNSYSAIMNVNVPLGTFLIASLSNEPIVYPQVEPEEVFRSIKRRGSLERVLTANKKGNNEFAVASIGVTKASVVDSKNININVTGMAFLMTRVNVLNVKKQKVSEAITLNDKD